VSSPFAQCASMRASFLIVSFASAFGPLYSIAAAHVLLRRALREPHGQSEGMGMLCIVDCTRQWVVKLGLRVTCTVHVFSLPRRS
jgi:hypothetical protein